MAKRKKRQQKKTIPSRVIGVVKSPFVRFKKRISAFVNRRPHHSFRRTRRRDYLRPLKLPGYVKFTKLVWQMLWKNRKLFILLAVVYAALTALLVGVASQDMYSSIVDTFNSTSSGSFTGFWGELGKAGLLFASTATGGLTESLSEIQQVFAALMILMVWLTSVWLLRNIIAGHKVKLREGLYSSGSPILSTFIVALLLMIQLLPVALAFFGYSAAVSTGLLNGGVEAMLFWFAAGLLAATSLYLITSTVFALVIVTLPGMYPGQAIKMAGDLVIGRRMKIFFRLAWLLVLIALTWALVMIPMIIFDSWIKSVWSTISWIPIVPVVFLILSSITVVWVSSYVYMLYRKVVDDESETS